MALTRKLLKSMGLTDEQVDSVIEAHSETVDGLKADRDKYKADSENLASVSKELESLKESGGDWKTKFEKEHSDFESFKTATAEKETNAMKQNAFKKILRDAGISENRFDSILRVTDLSKIDIDKDGNFVDSTSVTERVKAEWSDFIVQKSSEGVATAVGNQTKTTTYSRDDISKMSASEINANWDAIKASLGK